MASVTKTFILKGIQIIHRSKPYTIESCYAFKCKRFRNTRQTHLEYHCKAVFVALCIASGSHSEQ
jgi:hypothetical protein